MTPVATGEWGVMRRGWVIAGALILAVPTVPVAADRMSPVLEHVRGPGKWIRTGDVQRFGVRVNGMAGADRAAVASGPAPAPALAAGTGIATKSPEPGIDQNCAEERQAGVHKHGAGAVRQPMRARPAVLPSLSAETAQGVAPWPWGVAVARKRVEPVRWASPLDGGATGLPFAAMGIGVLLGALWLIGTVQRRQKRKT
ncbi:hypothetical protein [Nonomuraea sp. NPDC049400]|uniref:hypothetical protein n=1 Tax=Nonomuraea sp. NPDC049400 TaxID=3364352 RepID=UPI0037908924